MWLLCALPALALDRYKYKYKYKHALPEYMKGRTDEK